MAVTVDPHGSAAVAADPSALASLGKGGSDRGADEGKNREVVILLGVLHVHALSVRNLHEVRAAVGGQVGADGLQAEPLAEGVGGVEGLGTHGLARAAPRALHGVRFVILVGDDGLSERRGCEEGVYGGMGDVGELVVPVRDGMSVSDRRNLGHNDPDRTRGNGCPWRVDGVIFMR